MQANTQGGRVFYLLAYGLALFAHFFVVPPIFLLAVLGAVRRVFAALAFHRSDCGSFEVGGDLGEFTHGEMQQPFEEAVQALKVGEVSGIVTTDSGTHIIFRTA